MWLVRSYQMPEVDTCHASAVRYKDGASLFLCILIFYWCPLDSFWYKIHFNTQLYETCYAMQQKVSGGCWENCGRLTDFISGRSRWRQDSKWKSMSGICWKQQKTKRRRWTLGHWSLHTILYTAREILSLHASHYLSRGVT